MVIFGKPQRGLAHSSIIPTEFSKFNFNYKILPRIAYEGKLPTSPFHFKRALIFFPTLLFEIVHGRYSVVISDGVGNLLNVLPLFIVNKLLLRKAFILWCGGNIKDNAPKPNDSIIKKIAYVLARLLYKHCDACIVYGKASKHFDMYMGANPNKIFIALNTVDTLYFEETIKANENEIECLRKKLGINGKKCVLYVGILEKRKKVDNLILAFKKLKLSKESVILLIIGDGPQREFLQDLCVKEQIKDVRFLGKIDYGSIPLYYALSDVFVLPAQGGIAVSEAMACGKPVIITEECNALRSIPSLVKNGENGFIVKEGDIDSLAEYMNRVLRNPTLVKKMGLKSKEMVQKYFSIEKMLHGFERAIDYVVIRKIGGVKDGHYSLR